MTYDDYTKSLPILRGIVKRVIEVEKAVLNCGLKAFDFGAAAIALRECVSEASALRDAYVKDLEFKKAGQSNIHKDFETTARRECNYHCIRFWAIEATIEYLTALNMAASCMVDLADGLNHKAKGGKFGYFAYRRLYKEHKSLDKIRHQAWQLLDVAHQQKW
jgi:hypothetical protein